MFLQDFVIRFTANELALRIVGCRSLCGKQARIVTACSSVTLPLLDHADPWKSKVVKSLSTLAPYGIPNLRARKLSSHISVPETQLCYQTQLNSFLRDTQVSSRGSGRRKFLGFFFEAAGVSPSLLLMRSRASLGVGRSKGGRGKGMANADKAFFRHPKYLREVLVMMSAPVSRESQALRL